MPAVSPCAATACGGACCPALPACGSPRLLAHPERDALVDRACRLRRVLRRRREARRPEPDDKPVIVGGGKRGVVSTACYVARTYRGALGDADVQGPEGLSRRGRGHARTWTSTAASGARCAQLMLELTPLVEPVSIDEAFLDLSGTERLHHAQPGHDARALRAARRGRDRHHGLGRAVAQQVPGEDRLGPREAARLLDHRPGRDRGAARRYARRRRAGHRRCGAGAAGEARHHPSAPPARHAARRSHPAARARSRRARPVLERRGRPAGAPGAGDEERFGRDHLRRRPARLRGAASRSCGACASGCRGG